MCQFDEIFPMYVLFQSMEVQSYLGKYKYQTYIKRIHMRTKYVCFNGEARVVDVKRRKEKP